MPTPRTSKRTASAARGLTEIQARALRGDGSKSYPTEHFVAPNLYLQVTPKGAKSWLFKMERTVPETGKPDRIKLGLGSWDIDATMPKDNGTARTWRHAIGYAAELKSEATNGRCPRVYHEAYCASLVPVKSEAEIEAEIEAEEQAAFTATTMRRKRITVHDACMAYLDDNVKVRETLDEKTRNHWHMVFRKHVYPKLGKTWLHLITRDHVLALISDEWISKHATMVRVRQRLEFVIAWARTQGYADQTAMNPAQWKNNISENLPSTRELRKKKKVQTKNRAIPYLEIPAFWRDLEPREGMNAKALRFKMHTLARTENIRFARWEHIDLTKREWTIPAGFEDGAMKGGMFAHTVALSSAAIELLQSMPGGVKKKGYIFPNVKGPRHSRGSPLGERAMYDLMMCMGFKDEASPHGMRKSFGTWAAAELRFHPAVVEAVLAHIEGTRLENTYRDVELHRNYLERRFEVMEAWSAFVMSAPKPAQVVPIRNVARTVLKAKKAA